MSNPAVSTVELSGNITTASAIVLSRAVTLDGKGFTLSVKSPAVANTVSGLGITADNVEVKNLTVKLALDAPLAQELYQTDALVLSWNDNLVEVYEATGVKLTNVNVDGSGKAQAGIYVNNASKGMVVTFDNVSTQGNRWAGVGVNANGSTTVKADFINVTAASFGETTPAVYTEGAGVRNVTGLTITGITNTPAGTVKASFEGNAGKTAQEWWTK